MTRFIKPSYLFLTGALLLSTASLAQNSSTSVDEMIHLRSRWVCVANLKRGSVWGFGATMEEARDSVLRRCFPNSRCLANMRCQERSTNDVAF